MQYSLTLLEGARFRLEEAVFSRQGLEGAAYLLCGRSVTEDETRLLVREIVPVAETHYLRREPYRLSIDSASYASVAKRARAIGASIIFAHGHPFGPPDFSEQDDREEPKLVEFFSARVPGVPHGSLVLTPGTLANCRIWSGNGWGQVARIRTIGQRFRFQTFIADETPLPDFFDRHVRAFGPEIQRLLQRLHVGVVGLGGTGSPVVEQLIRLGVGKISIFDGEQFESSNVTRVYGSSISDEGKNKAEISFAHASSIGLGTVVRTYPRNITEEETAKQLRVCDIIFGTTDKQAPRGILVQVALQYMIPVFDLGVKIDAPEQIIRGINGRVTTLLPGEACLFCRERISSDAIRLESLSPEERQLLVDEHYAPQLETQNPAVITFTTAVAAQAVSEFLHRLTGFMGEGRQSSEVLMFFHETAIRTNRTAPKPDCICAKTELWGVGDRRDFLGLTWPDQIGDVTLVSKE
ncbi:MAG: ThiF family adenylyltransferase [Acidobacteriota bacterium]